MENLSTICNWSKDLLEITFYLLTLTTFSIRLARRKPNLVLGGLAHLSREGKEGRARMTESMVISGIYRTTRCRELLKAAIAMDR